MGIKGKEVMNMLYKYAYSKPMERTGIISTWLKMDEEPVKMKFGAIKECEIWRAGITKGQCELLLFNRKLPRTPEGLDELNGQLDYMGFQVEVIREADNLIFHYHEWYRRVVLESRMTGIHFTISSQYTVPPIIRTLETVKYEGRDFINTENNKIMVPIEEFEMKK